MKLHHGKSLAVSYCVSACNLFSELRELMRRSRTEQTHGEDRGHAEFPTSRCERG
jgi:hypothetical protein